MVKHLIINCIVGLACLVIGSVATDNFGDMYKLYFASQKVSDVKNKIETIREKILITPGETRNFLDTQVEYVLMEPDHSVEVVKEEVKDDIPSTSIDVSSIPNTKNWIYHGVDLANHISSEHGIDINRLSGLSYQDLVKVHSYLHNGGSL